jgi:hypothetical protein
MTEERDGAKMVLVKGARKQYAPTRRVTVHFFLLGQF